MLKVDAERVMMSSASTSTNGFCRLPLAARSNDRKMALLAIRNWDNYSLDDYFSEKEFVTLVKWVNNSSSTASNALNESATTPTTQPNPYDLLLDTAMEELAQELEELQLIRDERKELAQSQKSKN